MKKKPASANLFWLTKHCIKDDNYTETNFTELLDLLWHIYSLPDEEKIMKLKGDKICFLDTLMTIQKEAMDETRVVVGTLATGRLEYRPDIVNVRTLTEKENPREKGWAEKQSIYFSIRYEPDKILLALQCRDKGYIDVFRNYITRFFREQYPDQSNCTLAYSILVEDSFLEIINGADRISKMTITYDKKEIIDNYDEITNNDYEQISSTITTVVTSKKLKNVANIANVLVRKYKRGGSNIRNIAVRGTDPQGNKINIDLLEKIRRPSRAIPIDPEKGVFIHNDMVDFFVDLARNFA